MSNYSASDILSKKERRRLSFAVEEMKRQLEQAKTEHTTISKYYKYKWFQRDYASKLDMWARYRILAETIITIEKDIPEIEERLYRSSMAVEELILSPNPLDLVDLKTTTLIQQSLF